MTREEILKTTREFVDKAEKLKIDERNVDREMAYQQYTDLQTFLAMLKMIEMRITHDGTENALNVTKNYIYNLQLQIDAIQYSLTESTDKED